MLGLATIRSSEVLVARSPGLVVLCMEKMDQFGSGHGKSYLCKILVLCSECIASNEPFSLIDYHPLFGCHFYCCYVQSF